MDYNLFLNLFQGREGVFAKQWPSGEAYSPVRPDRQIEISDIIQHIQGTETYGIYPIRNDNKVKLVCLDIDLPKNYAELNEEALVIDKHPLLPQVKSVYTTIIDILKSHSFDKKSILVEDTGGRGYHVWVFFKSPISAVDARNFAYFILARAKVQCEVFPKQEIVLEGKYGNLIKLPLGLHKKYNQFSKFVEITEKDILPIEDPLIYLKEIVPIPQSIISKINKQEEELNRTSKEQPTKPSVISYKEVTGKIIKKPRIGNLMGKCKALFNLENKAIKQQCLNHEERLALAYIMINTKDGEEALHQILSNCSDYDRTRTQKEIDYLKTRKMRPITCRKLIEQNICDKFCRSEIRWQHMDVNRPEPSPIRFAMWYGVIEPESIWEVDIPKFESVYTKSNLYRAWEQIKEYSKVNEPFFDLQALEYFEEHLEENVETLRFELRNLIYSPQPYRLYGVPKKRIKNGFEYRRMAFLHPRDYVVIHAIVNVIGPMFEKTFSNNSCLGYRLDIEGKTGNSIFYNWQSAWQNRKKRVTSFLHQPEYFHYIKADILHFYDEIDRIRLYDLMFDKIGISNEICSILKKFLDNLYIDDINGEEKSPILIPKGIPQGPAFSAFFANIYLNDLDQLIEKNSYDYIRYVDDMVILCENKGQVEKVKKILEDYLTSIKLELNPEKTTTPCSIIKNEPLLDFLGEMKYGMAGLFVRKTYSEQLISSQFLENKLIELFRMKELTDYDLEDVAKHLSYYLKMQEKIKSELSELAINLSKKILEEYILKPQHLVIVLQVLIKNNIDLTSIISRHKCPYIKTVLCLLMLTTFRDIPPWVASLLENFIKDKSSYILRGTAYSVISKLCTIKYLKVILENLPREESLYVIEKSLTCLVVVKSDEAKRSFLELAEKYFNPIFNAIINATIKCGDLNLARLIKNKLKRIDKINIKDYYIFLEFIFIMCPEDFEESLIMLFSSEEALLIRQLIISSLGKIEKEVIKRGDLLLAYQLVMEDSINKLESNWLRDTLQEAVQEWKIDELSQSSTVYNWLRKGDQAKKYDKMQDLSSKEHKRQGGYKSWIMKDQTTNKNFILEAVEEEILKESIFFRGKIAKEDIKYIKGELEARKLSSLSDFFVSVEGGKKFYWFKYIIPDGYDILCNVYNGSRANKKFNEQEVLDIIIVLFRQVELIKECIDIEPVINPYTVILGSGNQVCLVNLFFGIPRKLYVSTEEKTKVDISTTTNSFFSGLLSFELISSECPIKNYNELESEIVQSHYMSDYLPKSTISFHFAWILDRLCNPMHPINRYDKASTLEKDIDCFRKFRHHFQNKKLVNLSSEKKYLAEVLDVLNLRVARFLKVPYKDNDSIHEKIHEVFDTAVYSLYGGRKNTKDNFKLKFDWTMESLIFKLGINSVLHESGHKCDLFATGLQQKFISTSKITQWQMTTSVPSIIFYIPLKIELIALAIAIGLFNIHDKDDIKMYILDLMSTQSLPNKKPTNEVTVSPIITSNITKIINLMNLFINKHFQEAIRIDGSDLCLLILLIFILLEKDKELWAKWHKSMGLSSKSNLKKAISCLECIVENNIKVERLLNEIINEPLKERPDDNNNLIDMYNFCLQDISRFRKIMKILRKRTFIEINFHPSFEKNVTIRCNRKTKKLPIELIIPFPRYYKMIWKNEAITFDFTKSEKNTIIKALSLTPSSLKDIVGWEYKNLFKKSWAKIKKYSKKILWKISAFVLFGISLVLFYLKSEVSGVGVIFLTISIGLLSPYIQELYERVHKATE